MAAETEILRDEVRSYSIGIPGRSLNSARTNHFVIDEPAFRGGPGEAITPAEAFLAGVSACGVLLVQSFAQQSGIPCDRVDVSIAGTRLRSDPGNYQRVDLRFDMAGPTPEQAEKLVEQYKNR